MRHLSISPLLVRMAIPFTPLLLVPFVGTAKQAHAAAATTQVKGREFHFTLSKKAVARPGTVTFEFTNTGTVAHDFKSDGKATPLVAPGHTAKLVVRFKKAGRFSYLRTVPGHAAAGVRGVYTVR